MNTGESFANSLIFGDFGFMVQSVPQDRFLFVGHDGPLFRSVVRVCELAFSPIVTRMKTALLIGLSQAEFMNVVRVIYHSNDTNHDTFGNVMAISSLRDGHIGANGFTSVPSYHLLANATSYLARGKTLNHSEWQELCKAIDLEAVRGEARQLWHDVRNACTMLSEPWQLLNDDGAESWAFATEERDCFRELAMSSCDVRQKILRLQVLLKALGVPQPGEGLFSPLLTLFTTYYYDSPVLSAFAGTPSPRHPEHQDEVIRERYAQLIAVLLGPRVRPIMLQLAIAIEDIDLLVAKKMRGVG